MLSIIELWPCNSPVDVIISYASVFWMVSVGQLKLLEGYQLYAAMYEFTARSDDELSLNPGDLVWVCTLVMSS